MCLTLATCFSIVSSTASQLSPLINIERFFKNGRDTKGNIIYQLKIIPGLKDVHNVANVHPSDISARNKVHLTRKITKIIDESQVMRVVKQDHLKNPLLLVKLATDSASRDAVNQEVFKLPLLCIFLQLLNIFITSKFSIQMVRKVLQGEYVHFEYEAPAAGGCRESLYSSQTMSSPEG